MMMSPCLNCPNRTALCHDNCDKYGVYKAEREAIRKKQHEAVEMNLAEIEGRQRRSGANRTYGKFRPKAGR